MNAAHERGKGGGRGRTGGRMLNNRGERSDDVRSGAGYRRTHRVELMWKHRQPPGQRQGRGGLQSRRSPSRSIQLLRVVVVTQSNAHVYHADTAGAGQHTSLIGESICITHHIGNTQTKKTKKKKKNLPPMLSGRASSPPSTPRESILTSWLASPSLAAATRAEGVCNDISKIKAQSLRRTYCTQARSQTWQL